MRKALRVAGIGYVVIAVTLFVAIGVVPFLLSLIRASTVEAQSWQAPPVCELEQVYNRDFDLGRLGWEWEHLFWHNLGGMYGAPHVPYPIREPFNGAALHVGDTLKQPVDLGPGNYKLRMGMLLHSQCPLPAGYELPLINWLGWIADWAFGGRIPWCGGTCGVDWDGTHWGSIQVKIGDTLIAEEEIPDYSLYDYIVMGESEGWNFYWPEGVRGNLTVMHWSPCWCAPCVVSETRINLDWVSLCRESPPTVTPTVTGTPPDTPTPTTTPTVFCESTDYPTGTPYPSSTPYPTNTPWLTPPVFITPTPFSTYTRQPTCVPTVTKTPYASPTPFRFGLPLTYTNQFGDLQRGMTEFFSSTEGLLSDVSGLLISASVAVSDVTAFGVTNTVVISGTPVATTDMVTTFVSNMDALRYVFGWFSVFRQLAPGPFWFLLLCLAWTFVVYAIKFVSSFLATVIWPLARTVWDVIIDIWNSIPFL